MSSGIVDFEDYFQGADDTAKVVSMNAYYKAHAGKQRDTTRFPARTVTTSVPIEWWSGLSLIGGAGLPVREYSRRPTIRYVGPAGSALFKFTGSQTNQSYPADGSPRDISITGIQFNGGASVDCVESVDTYTKAKVAWYVDFHNCGFNGWRRIWHGFVDGCGITRITHMQAFSDTAIFWRGSEATLFDSAGFSFCDSSVMVRDASGATVPVLAGKPMLRFCVSKGEIGRCMPTTRKDILALLIDSGAGIRVHGFSPDSQDSDPCYGSNIRIDGNAKGVIISDSTFKGGISDPAKGAGGAAKNRGIIHVEQGADVLIDHNVFIRQGPNPGPTTTPLVYAGLGVSPLGIRIGLNGHVDYDGIVAASKAGQFDVADGSIRIVQAA